MIDEFTLVKSIGKGAFGEVFLSKKQGSSTLFAIKKVPKSKADSPAIKKYFINEITILKEISHPYIIHFEAIKHTIHNYYIITEFCNGGDLSSCLKKYKSLYYYPFSEEIVQHLMRQIVSAIKYLHSKRIIHRDLKLENILVNFDNENDKARVNMLKAKIKVIDFGFATHLGASNLRFSTLGSPINMDPILLKKLANKNKPGSNLIGYDEKADIWSLGTVCYELLIGHEMFNAQTMVDLIQKVESGNYHVPTHLSKEVVSFLNAMLQYSAKKRLSAEELSRHAFLTKNVKDFQKLDLRKVSHKVDNQGLNINIKRNQSIWAIFNQEDEKTLIDIPGKYLVESPIQELEELLGIKNNVDNKVEENPFTKPINININVNNKMKNNNQVNNQISVPKKKEENIDYNLLKKQQKMYHEINLKNDKMKRYANYAHNNPFNFTGTNNNNYYANHKPKYYTPNLNGPNNITNVQNPQNNQILVQYPQYQNQTQKQNTFTTQTPYYQTTNIQNIKTAPVKSQQDLINQGFYQSSPNTNNVIINNILPEPSNNYNKKILDIQVQKPIYPSDNTKKKTPQDKINISKISGISNITTKTVQMPKGARMPKSYYEYYNNPHSKSPVSQNNINNNKNLYQKQMTFTERNNANYYLNNNNQNIPNNNKYNPENNIYHTTKEIRRNDNINSDSDQSNKNKTITITINHNKERKGSETYTIKYENNEFPSQQKHLGKTTNIKIKKLEEPQDEYPVPSDFSLKDKNTSDYNTQSNSNKSKEKYKNKSIDKNDNKKHKRNDSFPMPESDEEKERNKSNDSKNDDDSENLEELIDFKLGEEVCPEPEDEKYNLLNDDNEKEKEDNFEMTMKQKIMERTVERPTIGVPPPGTDPNDNYDLDEDDDNNNGVFQTNKNNIINSDDINFEI